MLSEEDKAEIKSRIDKLEERERALLEKHNSGEGKYKEEKQGPLKYAQLGFEFVGGFLLFFFIGRYLDNRFDGGSYILMASIFVGLFFSMYRLIREAQNIN